MKKLAAYCAVVLVAGMFMSGCSAIQNSTVKTKSDYQKVWIACLDAVSDVQFSVSSTDPTSGMIIADQAVMGGHGKVSRLNIRLSKDMGDTLVFVKFIPPPGTIGGGGTTEKYVTALKERFPDLEPVVVK